MAIGVAGFTGVISIFRRRSGGEDALSAWRTSTVLTTSLSSLLLATFPMGLVLTGLTEPMLWRVCSGVYVLVAGLVVIDVVRRRRRLPESARQIVRDGAIYPGTLYLLAGLAVLSQLLNLHPSLLPHPAGAYFFATLALIGASCVIFFRTLFGPHPDR